MRPWKRHTLMVFGLAATSLSIAFVVLRAPDLPQRDLEERWAKPPSTFVQAGGMRVHVRDEGAGPPILLLHGTGASLHTWDGWAAELSKSHRVVRLDLQGFGLTGPHPTGDYSVTAMAELVHAVSVALQVGPAVVAGNSMGGDVAWNLALDHPEDVRALVLVDAGGFPRVGGASQAFRLARLPGARRLASLDTRGLVKKALAKSYGDPSKITPELVERYQQLSMRPGNRAAFIERVRMPFVDRSAELSRVKVPTLILWGELDRVITPDRAELFQRAIAGSTVVLYPGLGHVPMEEDPATTVRDVSAFVAKLP